MKTSLFGNLVDNGWVGDVKAMKMIQSLGKRVRGPLIKCALSTPLVARSQPFREALGVGYEIHSLCLVFGAGQRYFKTKEIKTTNKQHVN